MEDKDFEKMMYNYVEIKKNDKEYDLRKITKYDQTNRRRRIYLKPTFIIGLCIIAALCVALPILLRGSDIGNQVSYFGDDQYTEESIGSFEGFDVNKLKITSALENLSIIREIDNGSTIGLKGVYFVFSEKIEYIIFQAFMPNKRLSSMQYYENLYNPININNTDYKYEILDNLGLYQHKISYTYNNYFYCIDVLCYHEMSIETLLAIMF